MVASDAMVCCAIVTMTTVGYGDIIPLSETGWALTLMMILTGIALIPKTVWRPPGALAL